MHSNYFHTYKKIDYSIYFLNKCPFIINTSDNHWGIQKMVAMPHVQITVVKPHLITLAQRNICTCTSCNMPVCILLEKYPLLIMYSIRCIMHFH